eukprot:scaffold685_cov281-Pinguiococcus_pyrenoidosus.AAC.22
MGGPGMLDFLETVASSFIGSEWSVEGVLASQDTARRPNFHSYCCAQIVLKRSLGAGSCWIRAV